MNVRRPETGDAALKVLTGELADGKQLVHAELCRRRAHLAVVLGPGTSELRHVTEDRDTSPFPGALGQIGERGAHGDRVGVVGVVDEQAAAREVFLLPAPAGEIDVDGLGTRQAECVERSERRRRVLDLMLRAEVEAHTADGRSAVAANRFRHSDAYDLDV